jgi:hypothetical protein
MELKGKKLTFQQSVEVEAIRLSDLLTSAFEGGCGGWMSIRADDIRTNSLKVGGELNIEKQILLGTALPIYDAENPETKLGELSMLKIVAALQAMAEGKDLNGGENEHLKKHFNDFIIENDDAETADVVIQIATMGSIVFG